MAGPAESRVAVAAAAPPTPSAEARPRFSLRTFESLRLGPYRWLFASMLGQMAAMHMQLMVRGYLAFTLTGSFSALGLVGLASALPMLSLSLVGGVLARPPLEEAVAPGRASLVGGVRPRGRAAARDRPVAVLAPDRLLARPGRGVRARAAVEPGDRAGDRGPFVADERDLAQRRRREPHAPARACSRRRPAAS